MDPVEIRRSDIRHALVVAVLAAALYAPSLGFGFNDFDDRELILDSQHLLRDPAFIPKAFLEDAFHAPEAKFYYRPMLTLSFMADASWGRTDPFAYRLTNLLLHVLAVVLAWSLLRACGAGGGASLLAAAGFAVHPALTQAVAWIPGRNDTLLAVFVFASFLGFVLWARTRRGGFAALHLVCWSFALLTKESAVAVPVLAVAWAVLVEGRRRLARGDAALVAGWIALGTAWFAMRHYVLANPYSPSFSDTLASVAAAWLSAAAALGFLAAPWNLSVYVSADAAHAAVGAVALALLAIVSGLAPRERRGRAVFGLVWLVVFLVPSLARPYLVDPGEFLVHRLYVPAFGAALALAVLAPAGASSRIRKPVTIAAVVVIAVLAAGAVGFLPRFRDAVSFWENAAARSAGSAFAQRGLGAVYYEAGRWSDAAAAWERSLALDPDSEETRSDLPRAYRKMGVSDATRSALESEVVRNPRNAAALYWLGVCLDLSGRYAEAAERWEAAVAVDPGHADAWAALVREALASDDTARAARYVGLAAERGVTIPEDLAARMKDAAPPSW